ncbi:MAG: T9SS type A sorting domain-containing protein, partial [Ignavibacterium sp.]|nr:T9SS type A sorting domain-containing protein [Ignavibacterium sp.]
NLIYPDSEPVLLEIDGSKMFQPTYVEDESALEGLNGIGDNTILLEKWNIQQSNNVIPPDPTLAVGPNHVMVLTNDGNGIGIYDKQGTLLKLINSTQWWSAVYPSQSGDPQIIYDHYAGRWVMVFMQVDDAAQIAGDLIAYSDDEDPFGTWYMYRLPSDLWGDFPQIGFDEEAIYIVTNNVTWASQFAYPKLRIINKSELYNSNGGPLSFNDIWDITLPGIPSNKAYNLRPSFQYSPADGHYFLYAGNSQTGTGYYSFYKLANPTSSPVLTGVNISVPIYYSAPRANQLGGGTPLIESGGSTIRNAPIFRDGFLYAAHSIRNSVHPANSSVKYFKVDVSNNTIVESAELGASGYYYIYPGIAVDKDGNIVINFSRSANTEYMGAYYTSRRATDPPGLSSAYTLQEGLGNYVKTFSGTRNRWGDYMGAFLDPADQYSFWMCTEYASTGNNYAVSVGRVRLEPFAGTYVFPEVQIYNFGQVEVGLASDTITTILANYGTDDLIISSIPSSVGDFTLVSSHTFPITLQTYDTLFVKFIFNPTTVGEQNLEYEVFNNSTSFTGFSFSGSGFEMIPAEDFSMYAVTGLQNGGQTVSINKSTGSGTNIGPSNYTDLIGLAIHPVTKVIYSVRSSVAGSILLRLNSGAGDAYPLYTYPLPEIFSIAFDSSGTLYGVLKGGQVYELNLEDGTYNLITTIPCQRISVKFHPQTNELWGTVKNFLGNPKDQIVKIDLSTGDTTRIGRTGYNVNTIDLAFDESNQLYGIKGAGTLVSDLFRINQTTGTGTMVGSVGIKDLTGLSYSSGVTSVQNDEIRIPIEYSLYQNYPNPFNPSTQIKFALPINSSVRITIYNLLGEVVRELVNTDMNTGVHTVQWNSEDVSGRKVSSGIYFYEINANGVDGNQFNQVRKMILMK